jgi:hypothetical protein
MRKLTLFLALVAGCNASKSSTFDVTTIAPARDGDPYTILRVNDSPPNVLEMLALSGDYLYFAVSWNGIHRMPKYGGTVSDVDTGRTIEGSGGRSQPYLDVRSVGSDVMWSIGNPGANGVVNIEFLASNASGGVRTLLQTTDNIGGRRPRDVQTDDKYIYFVTEVSPNAYPGAPPGPAPTLLRRIPLGGGSDETIYSQLSDLLQPKNAWFAAIHEYFVDHGDVFLLSGSGATGLELDVIRAGTATAVKLADLSASDPPLIAGVDATTVYLVGQENISAAPRAGGAVTTLYQGAPGQYLQPFAVDANNVYVGRSDGNTAGVFAQPKQGGALVRIANDGQALLGAVYMAQDDQHLFFIHGKTEILMLPKTPKTTLK